MGTLKKIIRAELAKNPPSKRAKGRALQRQKKATARKKEIDRIREYVGELDWDRVRPRPTYPLIIWSGDGRRKAAEYGGITGGEYLSE